VSKQARKNAGFLLTQTVVEEWEQQHGRIPAHAWVLVRGSGSPLRVPALVRCRSLMRNVCAGHF
jgi:hypothetical protein